MLSLVMFINRCGSMVIPFMSVYLTESLHFSLSQTRDVLVMFGFGSLIGSFLGGWLSDKIGHFYVQFLSLTIGGACFVGLSFVTTYEWLAISIFIVSMIYECLRPANASSISHYARPENVTRAFSLNRMAVNLGFSIGPVLGGILATISYQWLFWADGITCMTAGTLFYFYFRNRKGNELEKKTPEPLAPHKFAAPHKDRLFVLFTLLCACYAIVFFQLFNTLPLYFRKVYELTEFNIGLLLGLNGLIVFLCEMIFVYLVGRSIALWKLIGGGTLLVGLALSMLNLFHFLPLLYLCIALLSFSEILAMPFMATLTTQRSSAGNRGAYMGMYTMAYSVAFILAPYLGMEMVNHHGFSALWWAAAAVSVITAYGFYAVVRRIEKQEDHAS